MHHRLSTIVSIVAVAVTASLTGCTAQPVAPSASGRPGSADEIEPAAETPFTPYWNAMYGVHDAPDEIAQREEVESLVAACMVAEGFDYVPVNQKPPKQVTDYMQGYGTADWVAQHGYGAFPTAEETRQMDSQIASEDPNQEYVASLSDSEVGAYYDALQGAGPDRDDLVAMKDGELPEYDWQSAGCLGRSQHEVLGDDPTQSEQFEPLIAAMNALEQDQLADPAMAPIDSEWSSCMAAAGFAGLPTRQSAVDAVFAQSSEYWASGATDEPDDDVRADWREYELEVAVADFDCAEKVEFTDQALAVQIARENQFIVDNEPQLDELLAALAQGE